jgi:1,5-anhydro-D-fructose reductase (1,5-anhydro-D-mannitol-forming)
MEQRVRWGIIGCGNVVERKSGAAFQHVEGSALVAVMRRSRDLAEAFARHHSVPCWTTDADEVIGHPEVDAVYVATPPGYHLEYALRVCAAGKPCLVEKPLGRSAAECRRAVTAFKERGIPLFVAYYRRYLPKFVQVKEMLASGVLGPITSVQYRYSRPGREHDWRIEPRLSGGGLFWDLGCHVLDLFDDWFGPLELLGGDAASHAQTLEVEDTVALSFRTATGVLGTALWNFAARSRSDRLEIDGLRGKLTLAGMHASSPCVLEVYRHASHEGVKGVQHTVRHLLARVTQRHQKATRQRYRFSPVRYVHEPLIRSVVDSLLTKTPHHPTSEAALRTSCLMDAVLSAYYGGRQDAFWERALTWRSLRAISAVRGYHSVRASVTEANYRLSEAQMRFFFEHGYLGPFKCDSSDLERLQVPGTDKKSQKNRHLEDPILLAVCSHPSIVDRVAQLLGSLEVKLFKSRFWVKPAGTGKPIPWHQDVGASNGGFFEDGRPVPTVTAWLALDAATQTNGTLRVIPGSHRRFFGDWERSIRANLEQQGGLRDVDLSSAVPLEAEAGEFYIFHSWLLHSSGPNTSEDRRAALNMRFIAPGGEAETYMVWQRMHEVSGERMV